ncbi:hypothetical protein ACSBM8_17395 [Sphingomonas sp. ASY06-1R]|uniref:hypothetical protein n=1 Tax=Sphingomonas sp. ASY06-1R TaxID=3445771 RepID=UPI003FA2FB13
MSEHAIEDLVENSIRLLLASDSARDAKLRLTHDLYRVQALFDTSDTTGRLRAELAAIGYDPDAPASDCGVLSIVAEIMALADAADDRQRVRDWLAVLAAAIDEAMLDDTLPQDFATFRQQPEAIAIREIAGRHQARGWRGLDASIRLPSWSSIAQDYDRFAVHGMDRRSMVRFLLDHRVDAARIAADFDKDRQRVARTADTPLECLPEIVARYGAFRCVADATDGDKRIFAFAVGDPSTDRDAARVHLVIEHNRDLNVLYPLFGVRSGLIERWQGHTPGFDDATMHFSESMIGFVPSALLEADKQLGGTGWRWRLDQSGSLLEKRVAAIVGYWRHAAALERFYAKPLSERIDEEGFETMARTCIERANAYGFFINEVDMLFACACRSWDRGVKPTAEIVAIRDWLTHVQPDKRADRVACLARLEDGPAFPAHLGRWPLRR